jgi:hypothetical protein
MRPEIEQFWLDVLKNIIDKLLVGAVVGIAILVSTQWIEKNKLVDSTYIELNKKKLEKLAEVWEQAYLLDRAFPKYEKTYLEIDTVLKDALTTMQSNLKKGANPRNEEQKIYDLETRVRLEYSKKISKIKKAHLEKFEAALNKNRFWIESRYLSPLEEYSATVGEIARISPLTNKGSIDKVKVLENKLRELSVTINDVRNDILEDEI